MIGLVGSLCFKAYLEGKRKHSYQLEVEGKDLERRYRQKHYNIGFHKEF